MTELKIMSVNVRGLRSKGKRGAVFAHLSLLDFQVCLLQEVHLKDGDDCKRFSKEWGRGESRWGVGGVHSTGVGVLFGGRDFKIIHCLSAVKGQGPICGISTGGVRSFV